MVIASAESPPVFTQGEGGEWEIFNQEVVELFRADKYDRATLVAQEAIHIAENDFGQDALEVGTSLFLLAYIYRQQGEYAAEPICKHALANYRVIDSNGMPKAQRLLARIYRSTNREKDATLHDKRAARLEARSK